eukprot:3684540-Pyramimonas_sp.AAC.1
MACGHCQKARECWSRIQVDPDSHPIARGLVHGGGEALGREVDEWAEVGFDPEQDNPEEDSPELRQWLATLRFASSAERVVEGAHAQTHHEAKRVRNHSNSL